MLDDEDRALMLAFTRYLDQAHAALQAEERSERTPLGDLISEHLGTDAATVPVVLENVSDSRLVDADIALDLLSRRSDGRLIGVSGGEQRLHVGASDLISTPHLRFGIGPVDYADRASGPNTHRSVVSFGVRLLHHRELPIAVVQRAAVPSMGQQTSRIEVFGTDPAVVSDFLEVLRSTMVQESVLRGQVLSFVPTHYGPDAGATFLPRPQVSAADVVLPDGVLDEVVGHVVGIGEHRDVLRAAGQHLKRGVLLYGPPGTGKTLTVRHLLTRTASTTAVVLTGTSIQFISAAAEIARTFQPSVVVLEDIDLVAMERHHTPQPLLFEVLDALDGLDGDADVAFVMTTNRVEVLERALAERPGRVDLAVEIPLPPSAERLRLLEVYAAGQDFSATALQVAADRTEGTTGSFAKELVRRAVLRAAGNGARPTDDDLSAVLDDLLDARRHLTRRMLGSAGDPQADHGGAADSTPEKVVPSAGAPTEPGRALSTVDY